MSNLFSTLIIAFVVIVLAIACLAIGWLIMGKTKTKTKTYPLNPSDKDLSSDAPKSDQTTPPSVS